MARRKIIFLILHMCTTLILNNGNLQKNKFFFSWIFFSYSYWNYQYFITILQYWVIFPIKDSGLHVWKCELVTLQVMRVVRIKNTSISLLVLLGTWFWVIFSMWLQVSVENFDSLCHESSPDIVEVWINLRK